DHKDENIQYLNYLLERESWNSVYKQTSVNHSYDEFMLVFDYCFRIALPETKLKVRQSSNGWVTRGIRESGKRLRFLNKVFKEGNNTEEFKEYYYRYKQTYNKV
ncbi:hypothetical protein C0J52_26944, partial [Blattella germanica]